MKYFCVWDGLKTVYGVGATEDEAEQDSLNRIDGTVNQSQLVTIECSSRVYDNLKSNTSSFDVVIKDNILS